jgi:hypothetical protein
MQLSDDARLKSTLHRLVLVLPLTILIFEQALLHPDEKIKLPVVELELHISEVTPIFLMLVSFMLYRALRYARIILYGALHSLARTDAIVQIALDETEAYKVNSRYYEEVIDPMVADLLQLVKSTKEGWARAVGKISFGGFNLILAVLGYGLIFLMLAVMAMYVSEELYLAAVKLDILKQGGLIEPKKAIEALTLGLSGLLLLLAWLNVAPMALIALLLPIAVSLAAIVVLGIILLHLAGLLYKLTLLMPLRALYQAATRTRERRRDELFAADSSSYVKRVEEYVSSRPDAAEFRPRFNLFSAADSLLLRLRRVDLLFGQTVLDWEGTYSDSERFKVNSAYGLSTLHMCARYLEVFAQFAPLEFVSSDAWGLHEKLKSIVETYELSTDNVLQATLQKRRSLRSGERRRAARAVRARLKTIPSLGKEVDALETEFDEKDRQLFKDHPHDHMAIFDLGKAAEANFRQSSSADAGFAELPPLRGGRDSRTMTYLLGLLQRAVGLTPVAS